MSETNWIDIEFANYYVECDKRGLVLYSQRKVNSNLKEECVKFCKWLKKYYWFPIRITIHLIDLKSFLALDGKETNANFYYQKTWDEKIIEEKEFPKIYIATGKYEKQVERHGIQEALYNYFFDIIHELTHYYQWYFFQFEKRSGRSIERTIFG